LENVNSMTTTRIEVMTPRNADALERFAASELQRYLKRLFGVSATVSDSPDKTADCSFVLGRARDSSALVGNLSEQGFLLRKAAADGKPALSIIGGSSVAILWGVYELVERYGVRYLLHTDVYPEHPGRFHLPEIDQVFEPILRTRCWPFHRDQPFGPGSWGIADCRRVIDQLAKLKFNRIGFSTWPWEPFLDVEIGGIKRRSATLWFDYPYPITDDMPGRHLFGDEKEFWHPDLPPRGAPYEEFVAAGERFVHELIAHAHSRGMDVSFYAFLMEFAQEFRPIIPDAQTVHQLGSLTLGPGPDVTPDDPDLAKLSGAVIKAAVNTYPEADLYCFGMPEFRAWTERAAWAWQKLDEKYGIADVMSLEDAIEKAKNRTGGSYTPERGVSEVKADVTALYFFDRLFASPDVLPATVKPDARISIDFVAEELFPILNRVLPRGSEMSVYMDYTASHLLRRRHVLATAPTAEIPSHLFLTLHDDNVGVVPQLATGSLHELICDLREHGWAGFIARYWMPSDHDPCIAYMSRAAWDAAAMPEEVYADHIRSLCGEAAVGPMLDAFRELEAVTRSLEEFSMSLSFPEPGMMMKYWTADSFTIHFAQDREGYRRALSAVRRAGEPPRPEGRAMIDYWIHRLQFGIQYLDTIEAVSKAAAAEAAAGEARESGDHKRAQTLLADAVDHTHSAIEKARSAIETFARVAKDRSDCGAVAIMGEYVCRALERRLHDLRENARKPH